MTAFFGGLFGQIVYTGMRTPTMGYFVGLSGGLGLGLIIAVGLHFMMDNKPMIRGFGWGTFSFLVFVMVHFYLALAMFVLVFLVVAIKNEYLVLQELEEQYLSRPRQKVVGYREQKKREKQEAMSEDTESTQLDQAESDEETTTVEESSHHSDEAIASYYQSQQVKGNVLTRSLTEIINEQGGGEESTLAETSHAEHKTATKDEVMELQALHGKKHAPPKQLPRASALTKVVSNVMTVHSVMSPKSGDPGSPMSPSSPAKPRGPSAPQPVPTRGQAVTPPGTPPRSPRKNKFDEAENDAAAPAFNLFDIDTSRVTSSTSLAKSGEIASREKRKSIAPVAWGEDGRSAFAANTQSSWNSGPSTNKRPSVTKPTNQPRKPNQK
jgi:hypothetical protein